VKGYFGSKDMMDSLRNEPTTKLLSEMEGFANVWDENKQRFGIRLQRNSLPDYATEDFWEAVQMCRDWKTFGFPEHGGMNDQGALWSDVIRAMQRCGTELKVE